MKKLLVVVDYQKDFVDGALGFPSASLLDDKIVEAIESFDDVVFTFDEHHEDYLNTEEGKYLPVKHCFLNSEGYHLYGNTSKYLDKAKAVFSKPAFGSLDFGNWLEKNPYDEIYLCGLVSHICVLSNAIICKAANPNAHITVYSNLTDSYDKVLESYAFKVLNGVMIEVKKWEKR